MIIIMKTFPDAKRLKVLQLLLLPPLTLLQNSCVCCRRHTQVSRRWERQCT
jgi:hypothetical protein